MRDLDAHDTVTALLKSILQGPLLIGDLPEGKSFCRGKLRCPEVPPSLNLQQKLGHLFEDALASLIVASERFELLEQNLQLRDGDSKTIGEIDFLLRDRSESRLIHLELATKFYLAVGTTDGISLPGPDARDNYRRKLERLRAHQLQLFTNYCDCLPPEYSNSQIETRQLVYGCLFDHLDASKTFTPELASSDCRRGKWLHQQDCHRHFSVKTEFEIIPKPLWPVPFEFLENVNLERWDPSKPINRCLMVRADGGSDPLFVAPTGYPKQTT
jgi:hypothetical protein